MPSKGDVLDDGYAYNRRIMLILTVLTTGVLAVAAALMVLLTAHDTSDRGLAAYVVTVPIVFNALSFGLAWKDMEPDMDGDDIAYFRQRGLVFGSVIFAITLLVIAILAVARRPSRGEPHTFRDDGDTGSRPRLTECPGRTSTPAVPGPAPDVGAVPLSPPKTHGSARTPWRGSKLFIHAEHSVLQ